MYYLQKVVVCKYYIQRVVYIQKVENPSEIYFHMPYFSKDASHEALVMPNISAEYALINSDYVVLTVWLKH